MLRISSSRIYILTNGQALTAQKVSHNTEVMNKRYYIYDTMVAPNPTDDSMKPLYLLNRFKGSENAKKMLSEFIPEYIKSYSSSVREVFNTVPRIRVPIALTSRTYDSVTFRVAFWGPAFVYAVILENSSSNLLSTQVIHGLNENNTEIIWQHYANVTTDSDGVAVISFKLLNDNSYYTISVSAECQLPFSPRLALSDSSVMKKTFKTMVNPNLSKNQDQAIEVIKGENAKLGEEAEKLNRYV